MSIDEFIDTVVLKLPQPTRVEHKYMSGKELKLTGYGMGKNKSKIDSKGIYKVPITVPEKEVDHRTKLRLAWLRGGKPAVRTYLLKHLHPTLVETIITVI